jgi:hypothetical protein
MKEEGREENGTDLGFDGCLAHQVDEIETSVDDRCVEVGLRRGRHAEREDEMAGVEPGWKRAGGRSARRLIGDLHDDKSTASDTSRQHAA